MERDFEMELEQFSQLQHLEVKMFGRKYELSPAADLEHPPSLVGESLQNQAARFAFYASCHAMANAKVKALEKRLEQQRSKLDCEWRGNGVLPNGAKITDESVRRALRCDPDCEALQDKILDAEFDASILQGIVKAFEQRRDMVVAQAHRANNTTFHDRDINVTVAARITDLIHQQGKNVGVHPSKKTK